MLTIVGIYGIPDISNENYPAFVHDHNITVIKDDQFGSYLQTERLTRIKYDSSLPRLLENLAKKLKLVDNPSTLFVFVNNELGNAVLSEQGAIRFEGPLSKKLSDKPEEGNLLWFNKRPQALLLNHELAHIYSTIPFYGHFKDNSLLVHFDGGASKSNFSAWHYSNGEIKLIKAHYDYKWLSNIFNANALVFAMVKEKKKHQNAVPGKFMGLEAYGNYREDLAIWLKKNNFFENCWSSKQPFFKAVKAQFDIEINHIDNKDPFIQDLAATIHEIFLSESLSIFNSLQKETNAKFLYYSGGTALNIKLNSRLLKSQIFKDIYIPPCCNDSGLSIGASVVGAMYSNSKVPQMGAFLNNFNISQQSFIYNSDDIAKVADTIAAGKVIGICNGFGEIGPRALGNRSLLGRADNKALAKKISQKIKKREWYRPIAPVMLAKYFSYFTGSDSWPAIAKYMLSEFRIYHHEKEIKGCIHADNTARIQVVETRRENPFLFDVLTQLDKKYSIKALINTSFNKQGEPIVHTAEDAVNAAKEMKLDALVINGKLIIPLPGK